MTTSQASFEIPDTVGEALKYCSLALSASDAFYGHGTDSAWDEAVQLVLSAAGLPVDANDSVLLVRLSVSQKTQLLDFLSRRIEQHIPLPYLLGRAWFAGLEFLCDTRAIVPRSPIAELIHSEFNPWYAGPEIRRVLDLCCGGGCIGLATAYYLPNVEVDLADIDPQALQLARENVHKFGLENSVTVFESNLFSALGNNRYDLILTNPPYVDSADLGSMPAEYHHEPDLALGSGADGLDLTRSILASAARYLNPQGMLVVEVGNSAEALEREYPTVPFTWPEFENGGHGVFIFSASELEEFSASFAG